MADPTNMDDILSEKEPETVEKTAEAEPSEADKAAAVEAKKREYEGVKRAAQRKEWEAQGRDPETGQFIKKEETKDDEAEKAEKAKAEPKVKAEAKAAEEAKSKAESRAEKPEEMTQKERAAFAKAADETRKRQALEQRLRELED